jgi:type IV secretion system protein VirB2
MSRSGSRRALRAQTAGRRLGIAQAARSAVKPLYGLHFGLQDLESERMLMLNQLTRIAARALPDVIALIMPLAIAMVLCMTLSQPALAQASPFLTGATALETNILAWLTPVAIILVMVLGGMAMANRISWGWCIGAILGIAIAFGAPQIVAWVRGMFGV